MLSAISTSRPDYCQNLCDPCAEVCHKLKNQLRTKSLTWELESYYPETEKTCNKWPGHKKIPEQHLKSCRVYLPELRSAFIIQQYERDCAKITHVGELQGENHCWPQRKHKGSFLICQQCHDDPHDFWESWEKTLNILESLCSITSGVKADRIFQKMNIRQTNMMVIGWLSGTAWCFRIWTTCCNWRNHWFQFVPQNPEAVISHYKKRLWTKSKECGILFVCGLHCPAHSPEAGETNSAGETYLGTAVMQVEPKARSTHSHPSW